MEIQLKITGTLMIILAFLHYFFPKRFNWKQDLRSISLLNRQLMYIHSLFIAVIVLLMGLLCVTSSNELINTTLGKRVCLGLAIFWMLRLYIQFFGYSSKLWKGKIFETRIHILFAICWAYFSTVFILAFTG